MSSPEKEVREIAERYTRRYLIGRDVASADPLKNAATTEVMTSALREAQRLATERAERECAAIAREHAKKWEYEARDMRDLEDDSHIAAANAIAEAIEGRSKGK